MTDQSQMIQDVEQALQEANIKYELQGADVVDSIAESGGEIEPYVMDVRIRVHRSG